MQLGRLNVRAQSSVARGTSIGAARGRKPAAHHQDGATALAATAAPSGRAFGSGLPQVGAPLKRRALVGRRRPHREHRAALPSSHADLVALYPNGVSKVYAWFAEKRAAA
eukprot:365126-Chlamydomonas_euryale.AAC.52